MMPPIIVFERLNYAGSSAGFQSLDPWPCGADFVLRHPFDLRHMEIHHQTSSSSGNKSSSLKGDYPHISNESKRL